MTADIDAPITSVREHDSWWWERPGNAGDLGYSRPDVLLRCARIWGGRVKVIHQQVTTVTTTSVLPPVVMERACGLCRRYGHDDDACPSNPATWPLPPEVGAS
jgi:hypothetical protein